MLLQALLLVGAAVLYKVHLHKPLDVLASQAAGLLGGTFIGVPVAVIVFSSFIMLSRIGMWCGLAHSGIEPCKPLAACIKWHLEK